MSRWTISSSATAGQPGRPSSLQQWPSCITAPRGEAADLAVLGEDHVEPERVLHRPAHQQRVLHAVAVVGEDPHAGGDELGVRRQLLARPADRDAARRQHLAQPGGLALGPHEVDDAARVLRPGRCSASPRRPCSRRARRPASRSRSSRPPPCPARAGACGGRRSPGRRRSRRRRARCRRQPSVESPTAATTWPSSTSTSADAAPPSGRARARRGSAALSRASSMSLPDAEQVEQHGHPHGDAVRRPAG